jgi:hypothetical protein
MSLRGENWPAKRVRRPEREDHPDFHDLELMSAAERHEYYDSCWPPLPQHLIDDMEDAIERDGTWDFCP